ncbi:1-deoxy-D-xylulose-5-phosphate synthase [Kibdelosporangium aridum]|uniref:1-deoxy-D-xylulose-5-phosphate synthase n=2 Tax=Kibdelosporangium aridum TaxID=2030 RepID=A0A428Z513_KIBAR|nr:1-deoxy-D-xylulose-5-phosphate synthase [Kibdelosporangium aridum]
MAGGSLLSEVDGPGAVKAMGGGQLVRLADEIRQFLVTSLAGTGGHLGSNLGVVELTIALHRVFDSPRDRILFDTGHQAYVHKILTGRRDGFGRLRKQGGLSGYPSQDESEHDVIANSHASTAMSYADGLAKGYQLSDENDRHVVAVIGDGSLTGGMAWEALNNIAAAGRPVIIVLNDNGRSYSPTAGALATHLKALRNGAPGGSTFFEVLGLEYQGPVDGHDLSALQQAFERAKHAGRPVLVHCVTRKGKGYGPAEADDVDHLHATGAFEPTTGKPVGTTQRSWTSVFGSELLALARQDPKLVAITAAMLVPTGLHELQRAHPDRVYDVGLAEQHAVTSAAGLALAGMHPVVAIYSTFLNRAFDQVLLDLALHNAAVTLVLDRAGITGEDGPSHHGIWDLSILRLVPGMRVAAPRDGRRLAELLAQSVACTGHPTALRFPKGPVHPDIPTLRVVDGMDVLRTGSSPDVLVVSVGAMATACVAAADLLAVQGIGVTVIDPRWVAPVQEGLAVLGERHRMVVVVEDSGEVGGVGDGVVRLLRERRIATRFLGVAVPQRFHEHAARDAILTAAGMDARSLATAITVGLDNVTAVPRDLRMLAERSS